MYVSLNEKTNKYTNKQAHNFNGLCQLLLLGAYYFYSI